LYKKDEWVQKFELLLEFYAEMNFIPTRSSSYKGLAIGGWLDKQKSIYRSGDMPKERIEVIKKDFPQFFTSNSDLE
jgi:hypothetical protein